MCRIVKVTVWNEFHHERNHPAVQAVYPDGIHKTIERFLIRDGNLVVRTATMDEPDNGLPQDVLDDTDTLVWWGHVHHDKVADETVERVWKRVMAGMGLVVLHSAHFSRIFKRLMGTTCNLKWRDGARERVWVVEPGHPVAEGLPECFDIPETEMYGERFDIPAPDELVLLSVYKTGEVFRSGCAWNRGRGKVFYFAPGHETNPIYHMPEVQTIITNAVKWAADGGGPKPVYGNHKPVEF
jgi:trehalose utilization protein